jgi:hypothetical protein
MMRKTVKCLLIVSLIIPLALSGLQAQGITMQKWVVGSGGMVGEKNSENYTMSGLTGQIAIEKISNSVDGKNMDIYQGFWVLTGRTVLPVDEEPKTSNSDLVNYPNPFGSMTTIQYDLSGSAYVTLTIFDLSGNKMAVLVNGLQEQGKQQVKWDAKDQTGTDVGSGSYLYELTVHPAQMAGPGFTSYSLRNVMVVVR